MIKGYLFKRIGEHPKTEHTNNDQTETKESPFAVLGNWTILNSFGQVLDSFEQVLDTFSYV